MGIGPGTGAMCVGLYKYGWLAATWGGVPRLCCCPYSSLCETAHSSLCETHGAAYAPARPVSERATRPPPAGTGTGGVLVRNRRFEPFTRVRTFCRCTGRRLTGANLLPSSPSQDTPQVPHNALWASPRTLPRNPRTRPYWRPLAPPVTVGGGRSGPGRPECPTSLANGRRGCRLSNEGGPTLPWGTPKKARPQGAIPQGRQPDYRFGWPTLPALPPRTAH